MLKTAYNAGAKAAFSRLKIAIPISTGVQSADYGVNPSGPEVSHGTNTNTYPPRILGQPEAGSLPDRDHNADALFNISEYDKLAPGYTGEWGQEVIG